MGVAVCAALVKTFRNIVLVNEFNGSVNEVSPKQEKIITRIKDINYLQDSTKHFRIETTNEDMLLFVFKSLISIEPSTNGNVSTS